MPKVKSRRHQTQSCTPGGREPVSRNQEIESWGWGVAGVENGRGVVVPDSAPGGLLARADVRGQPGFALVLTQIPTKPDVLLRFRVEDHVFSFSLASSLSHFSLLPFRGQRTFFRLHLNPLSHFCLFVSGPSEDNPVA